MSLKCKRDLCYPCCRRQHIFSVIHHPLKVNAKYKNAVQNPKNAVQNAKTQCKVQSGLTSTVLSTTQVNWRHLNTFVCKTRMGIWLFAGTSGAEGCSCGLLFYRLSQQLGTSFLLIRCADPIMIKICLKLS